LESGTARALYITQQSVGAALKSLHHAAVGGCGVEKLRLSPASVTRPTPTHKLEQ